jgi:hypothetical protein
VQESGHQSVMGLKYAWNFLNRGEFQAYAFCYAAGCAAPGEQDKKHPSGISGLRHAAPCV